MTTGPNNVLFSWDAVEPLADLKRLSMVLEHLPDAELVAALAAKRGRGRNDFPVRAMWRALVAGVVFQHASVASLVRELRRNPSLLSVCGFNPLPRQGRPVARVERDARTGRSVVVREAAPVLPCVPNEWNFSRLLRNLIDLEDRQGLVSSLVDELRGRLLAVLPDYGVHLGCDGKAVASHSTGRVNRGAGGEGSDLDADWGKHETRGVDKQGRAWRRVKSWFGYGLHLIADTRYELPVAFAVTRASASEQPVVGKLLAELFEAEPGLAQRCRDFSADRGYDGGALKQALWDEHGIRPLIDTRLMWREEKQDPNHDPAQPILRSLAPERTDNILYSERGEVSCRCPATGTERPMAFQGFESDRGTLKYRCPAAACDLKCEGRAACLSQSGSKAGDFGRIVRIDLKRANRRIFTPTPWGSPAWRRGYNRRSALERINARLDRSFGFEVHFIRGLAKMKTRMGLALAVMMALAVAAVVEGRDERMRSLVRPVPFADTG